MTAEDLTGHRVLLKSVMAGDVDNLVLWLLDVLLFCIDQQKVQLTVLFGEQGSRLDLELDSGLDEPRIIPHHCLILAVHKMILEEVTLVVEA